MAVPARLELATFGLGNPASPLDFPAKFIFEVAEKSAFTSTFSMA